MEMKKKEWERPELIILVKSHPEENVLLHCKTGGDQVTNQAINTPSGQDCKADTGQCGACQSHKAGES
jgi:hypothetical protein